MDPRDILTSGSGIDFRQLQQKNFESQCVETILRELGRTDIKNELYKRCQSNCGRRELRLLELCDYFEDMPVALAARTISKTERKASENFYLFFKDFEKRKLYKTYQQAWDELAYEFRDRNFGLVVNWPHIPGGIVVHNMEQHLQEDGTRMSYRDQKLVLIIEPLPQFTQLLKASWMPD